MSECGHHARVIELLERIAAGLDGVRAAIESDDAKPVASLMTAPEFAELLCVNVRTLRAMCHAGTVPPPIRIGRSPRWQRAVVDRWLAKRRAA